jgi:cytoskeletal protein CcmA (bactofilin family)
MAIFRRGDVPSQVAAERFRDARESAQPLLVAAAAPRVQPVMGSSDPAFAPAGTVLAPDTVLEGTLRAAEPVCIAGTLQGTVEATAPVLVETGGQLLAEVAASEIVVAGLLDGRVQCSGRLTVQASGVVRGQVQAGTLRIDEGALLDGQLQMHTPASSPAGSPGAAAPANPNPGALPPAGKGTRSDPPALRRLAENDPPAASRDA